MPIAIAVIILLVFIFITVVIFITVPYTSDVPLKYKAGDMLQLKLTGEKVLVLAYYGGTQYKCRVALPSTNVHFPRKTVYIYEAELELVTGDNP